MPLYDGDTDALTVEQLPAFTDSVQVAAGTSRCTPDLQQILSATNSHPSSHGQEYEGIDMTVPAPGPSKEQH